MMAETRILDSIFPRVRAEEVDWDDVHRSELPRVFNYFRYRLSDRALAEDLTSTTFEKAWRARAKYRRDRASVGTWLLSIARNVAIDHFRASRNAVPLSDLPEQPVHPTLDADLQRGADERRLAGLIQVLPERERELLALKFGAEETNRAIARLTGLSESNVGTILSRTIATLRDRWQAGGMS